MASLTCSSNSFPSHLFAFPLVSSLAFTASFLPPVFISIFSISLFSYAPGKYLILQPRFYRLPRVQHSIRSHLFSSSVFSVLFPICLQYFLNCILCFGCFCFQCFPCYYSSCIRSRDFSLTRESNFLSNYWRVRLLSLQPRLFLYCPHSTTLSFMLQLPSFSISLLWIPWAVVHSLASVFSPTLLSGSSGIAISSSQFSQNVRGFLFPYAGFSVFSFHKPILSYAV